MIFQTTSLNGNLMGIGAYEIILPVLAPRHGS
jgi:hypothetical protein